MQQKLSNRLDDLKGLPWNQYEMIDGGLWKRGISKQSHHHKPLVSIITVVFQGGDILEATIKNISNQSYDNVEIIIIDGGSTDKTVSILQKYDSQIDYWISQKDSGIYDAMNKGIEIANGDWINFMNGGDYFYNKNVISNVFNNEIKEDIVFGKSLTCFQGKSITRYDDFLFQMPDWYFYKMPNHQAVFIGKRIYKNLKYDLSYKVCADTKYLREAFDNFNYRFVNIIISKFEIGGRSTYYGSLLIYIQIVYDSIRLNHDAKIKQFLKHSFKYLLQKILGRQRYLKYYFKVIKE